MHSDLGTLETAFQRLKPALPNPLIQAAHVNKRAQGTYRRGVMTAKDLQLRLYSFRRLTLVQYCTWSLV
jgi:hypothetical protein